MSSNNMGESQNPEPFRTCGLYWESKYTYIHTGIYESIFMMRVLLLPAASQGVGEHVKVVLTDIQCLLQPPIPSLPAKYQVDDGIF